MRSKTTDVDRVLHHALATSLRSARLLARLSHTRASPPPRFSSKRDRKSEPALPPEAMIAKLFKKIKDPLGRSMLLDLAMRLAEIPQSVKPSQGGSMVSAVPPDAARTGGVLLVDDDPDTICVTGAILRRAGYDVTTAATGDEALQLLAGKQHHFDALVTDYSMLGLNGLALIELALEVSPGLPAMIITGHYQVYHDPRLDQLPEHVSILSKPYSTRLLLAYVEKLVNRSRAREYEIKSQQR